MDSLYNLIPAAIEHTGPILLYLEKGKPQRGFILRDDEFVTSLASMEKSFKKAGLKAFPHKKTSL